MTSARTNVSERLFVSLCRSFQSATLYFIVRLALMGQTEQQDLQTLKSYEAIIDLRPNAAAGFAVCNLAAAAKCYG